jgi:hypothetical protein
VGVFFGIGFMWLTDPQPLARPADPVVSAARLVARHLILGRAPESLIATLAHALLREDAGFHAYQMLEAGVRQFREWGAGD